MSDRTRFLTVLTAGAATTLTLGLGAPAALALGVALGALVCPQVPTWSAPLAQRLLKGGVVALGAGLELGHVLEVGRDGVLVTAASLGLTLALGLWLTRRLRVEGDVGLLVTVGTGICGGSAVAATAPALRARGEHVGVALGVVFTLNALALVLFPPLGRLFGLSPETFARWCALAIHDTSSVVGAASAFDPASLELATITKLARALWIVPVVAVVGWLRSRREGDSRAPVKVPGFILAFLAVAALRSAVPFTSGIGDLVADQASPLLVLALFVTGLGLQPGSLLERARPAALMGVILWISAATVSLVFVTAG